MNKPVLLMVSTLLMLGCGGAHEAAAPPTMTSAPATPLPEAMKKLSFYAGEWDCEAVDLSPSSTHTKEPLHVSVVSQLGGAWLAVSVSDEHGPGTTELKGFDPKTGRFHHYWAATSGESGSLSSAGGWTGEQIVLLEDHPGPASKTRMVFTRVDDQHFTHQEDTDVGQGFQPSYLKSCRKVR